VDPRADRARLENLLATRDTWPTWTEFEQLGLKARSKAVDRYGGARWWAEHLGVRYEPSTGPERWTEGRPTMAFYELRHYAATRLLELGLQPADVAVQLGHADGGALVMPIYGHPSERAARARILAAVDGVESGGVARMRGRRGA